MHIHKIDTFSGHRDSVYTIVSDNTDHGFYSAGGDGFIIQWDQQKPDLGKLVARAGVSVYAICYDKERSSLWIGQNYEGIQILDTSTNTITKTTKIASTAIFDIQIIDDKALIALGDGVLVVMDIPSMSVQKHIKLADKSIRSIALSPSGNEIAVGDSNHMVHILDREGFNLKRTLKGHTNSVFSVCYSPNGRYLLTSGRDAHLLVWDATKQYILLNDIPAHMYAINHIVYSPDSRYFATASMDKSIKLWDASSFKLKKIIDRSRYAGHGTSVNKLLWTNFENQLISCSDDRTISVWDIRF